MGGLRNVAVTIPAAVTPGDTVTLQCQYDLENDPLYTVKWYKGRQEFFRYIPKELPHTRVFPMAGINVDVSIFFYLLNHLYTFDVELNELLLHYHTFLFSKYIYKIILLFNFLYFLLFLLCLRFLFNRFLLLYLLTLKTNK